MTRLIDADLIPWFVEGVGDIPVVTKEEIDKMPTVDAVPIRHGKWLPENRTMDAFWVCSCCGFPSEAHGAFKIYKFCPNCGADMREVEHETN